MKLKKHQGLLKRQIRKKKLKNEPIKSVIELIIQYICKLIYYIEIKKFADNSDVSINNKHVRAQIYGSFVVDVTKTSKQ